MTTIVYGMIIFANCDTALFIMVAFQLRWKGPYQNLDPSDEGARNLSKILCPTLAFVTVSFFVTTIFQFKFIS